MRSSEELFGLRIACGAHESLERRQLERVRDVPRREHADADRQPRDDDALAVVEAVDAARAASSAEISVPGTARSNDLPLEVSQPAICQKSVSTGPGASAVTVTPWPRNSWWSASENVST